MLYRFSRRYFHSLLLTSVLSAADRLQETEGRWQILDTDGKVIDKPVLVSMPLIRDSQFADVFDPGVQQEIRTKCFSFAKKSSGEFAAYIFTSIPPWNHAWVDWFRTQNADSPGKQQYVQFLKETYRYSIGDVNKAYGIDSTSFTDLGQLDWNTAKLEGATPRSDDKKFLGEIAETLFSLAAEAIRKADRTHFILGQQFSPNTPTEVIAANAAIVRTQNVGRMASIDATAQPLLSRSH